MFCTRFCTHTNGNINASIFRKRLRLDNQKLSHGLSGALGRSGEINYSKHTHSGVRSIHTLAARFRSSFFLSKNVFEIHGSHKFIIASFARRNFPSAAVAPEALLPRCCRRWGLRAPRSPRRASSYSANAGALDPSSCCFGSASLSQSHSEK